jgi:hypothetical protein
VSLVNELQVHRVSAWTVDDLIAAIGNDVDTYECRELFAPGFVRKEKLLAILRDILRREGYDEQRKLVGHMPVLTLDAATILVTTALQKAGIDAAPDGIVIRRGNAPARN